MFESTATWAEDKVFDDVNDWPATWTTGPRSRAQPLTSRPAPKMYGSAIWNHWLERRYGPDVVRHAWEPLGRRRGGFAPEAYDARSATTTGGHGFAHEFADFAAATAEWDRAGQRHPRGHRRSRATSRARHARAAARRSGSITLDHTGVRALRRDPRRTGPPLTDLTARPPGTAPPAASRSSAIADGTSRRSLGRVRRQRRRHRLARRPRPLEPDHRGDRERRHHARRLRLA